MSDLQRAFAKAKLAGLPAMPPPIFDEAEEEEGGGGGGGAAAAGY
jgi:protein phosphatase methylesterase 1